MAGISANLTDIVTLPITKGFRYKIILSDGSELGAGKFTNDGAHAPARIVGSGQGVVVEIVPGPLITLPEPTTWLAGTPGQIKGYPLGGDIGPARLSMSLDKPPKLHWEYKLDSWPMQGVVLNGSRVGLYAYQGDGKPVGLRVRADSDQQLGIYQDDYEPAICLDVAFVPVASEPFINPAGGPPVTAKPEAQQK